MSSDKIVAVLGSTGVQGGSVVRSLLADGTFKVRALTRKVDSDPAKELSKLGAEVVQAELDDVESLKKAFQGAYGVFGLTDFWSLFAIHGYNQPETEAHETQQGKNIVDAAEAAGVKHLVWSTLDHTEGVYVYHFESKVAVDNYIKSKSVPYTLLCTSMYFNNAINPWFGWLKGEEDGTLSAAFAAPEDTPFDMYDADETGEWVVPILKNPAKWQGKYAQAFGETISIKQAAETVQRLSGKTVKVKEVSLEEFNSDAYRKQVGDEIWLNNRLWTEKHVSRDKALSDSIYPNPRNWERFAKENPAMRKLLGI